jgi:uncharacterized protein
VRRPTQRGVPRRAIIIGVAAIVLAAILLGAGATFYTDLLWFREVGFTSVFWKQIVTKIGLGAVFGGFFAGLLVLNLWVVRKITSPRRLFTVSDAVLERYRTTLQPYVGWAVLGMALLFGLFAGSSAMSKWRDWLLYRNSVNFGTTDPQFHRDLSFYVFRLPFLRFVFVWLFSTLMVITIIVGLAHYFMGGIRAAPRGERVAPEVRAHLSVLGALIIAVKAWGYRLDQFDLLVSPRGTVTGASYTDVHAQLPALKLLVVIALVVAVLFLVNVRYRASVIPLAGIGLLILTSIFAGGIYPAAVQRFRVTPQERLRERPYIKRNIEATRTAYGIDTAHVQVRNYAARDLTARDLQENADTIDNIRLWNPELLTDAYAQLQRIKQYYEFLDVDVDRYAYSGGRHQVMVSAREITQDALARGAGTWVNKHLVYTHGFGLVASQVSSVAGEGEPDLLLKDVPPVASQGFPVPRQPRIYYGESEDTPFVVVRTEEQELDYPRENTFERTRYKGKGGINVGGFLRRAAFAWRFRDFNLLISGAMRKESTLIFRRRIEDRVRQVAPFLRFASDPYVALVDGRLVWIVDGFTTTDVYPYSERMGLSQATGGKMEGRINYIRNSVKATVDAYDGTITLYIWDPTDPLIRAWEKVFPTIFKPRAAMSADLLAHVRYPEDLFEVQTDRYSLYHITEADDFYSKEDAWEIAHDPTPVDLTHPETPSYYVLMRLPGEKDQQFILIRPYTPNQRKNMTAWLAARSDVKGYGGLISFVFPKERATFGPEQVYARINQDPTFSRERTLLDSPERGSRVQFGDLLVVPLQDSLLYVQPVYVVSEQSRLPELKRVVVASQRGVALGDTLGEALATLFGQAPTRPTQPPPPTTRSVAALIAQALRHYEASQEALRRGDFATYGREQTAMKRALDQAAEAGSASPSPSPSPRAAA